ncbi:MAG: DEAD/DEAH box helicase, partial [Pedobacter sp.]
PLIEKHHVYAEGFEIKTEKHEATPVIKVIYVDGGISQIQLYFKYGQYAFAMGNESKVTVRLSKDDDNYTFTRIKRNSDWEKEKFNFLQSLGLKKISAIFHHLELPNLSENDNPSYAVINWVNEHIEVLQEKGFEIEQATSNKRFVFGANKIDFEIKEDNDWFDINAIVYFGIHPIPFIALKQHILHKKREFVLPDGDIAIIPEKWFTQYSSIFSLADGTKNLKLKKHHIGLINDLAEDSLANVTLDRKLQRLNDFEDIADTAMPVNFKGDLRHYQKAGYNWFSFLREYNFGGCLADDMGLGKTIQTLAMLQKLKEEDEQNDTHSTSLIIMPTSLIYNWLNEAKKFTPKLKIHSHTGTFRNKDISLFDKYDLVITTYGVTRVDAEIINKFYFNYIILDESQNIKNPSSKSFKAVRMLKSRHKLVL